MGAGRIHAGWWRISEADPFPLEVRGLVDQPTAMPLEFATAPSQGPSVLTPPTLLLKGTCQRGPELLSFLLFLPQDVLGPFTRCTF